MDGHILGYYNIGRYLVRMSRIHTHLLANFKHFTYFSGTSNTTSNTTKKNPPRKWVRPSSKKPITTKRRRKEIIKDIFLIPDPKIEKVPRRDMRKLYYTNGLVASAVTLVTLKFKKLMQAKII